MSAPTRASQNGETDCFTDTAEEPLAWSLPDQFMPLPSSAFFGAAAFALASAKVEASVLSWLQSSLLTSISFMSGSLASAVAGWSAGGSASSPSALCVGPKGGGGGGERA